MSVSSLLFDLRFAPFVTTAESVVSLITFACRRIALRQLMERTAVAESIYERLHESIRSLPSSLLSCCTTHSSSRLYFDVQLLALMYLDFASLTRDDEASRAVSASTNRKKFAITLLQSLT